MKQKYDFIEFENIKEFSTWLDKQPKYGYTGIQEHHMAAPSYKQWPEDLLIRQNNIKDYHKSLGWGDIAQHFSTAPNGHIVTGRSLAKTTAIGIKGWNTKKICIENYGNFDVDIMTQEQKDTIIALTALLCLHEGITPSTDTIRYHCWFTTGGTYLGDYNKYNSCKTCPGKKFFGGNTKEKMKANFLPLVKKYMGNTKTQYLRVLVDSVNIHNAPDFSSFSVCGKVEKGTVLTIVKKIERTGTDMYLTKAGTYITASSKYIEVFEK